MQAEGARLWEIADETSGAPCIKFAAKMVEPSKAIGDQALGYLIEALRPTAEVKGCDGKLGRA